jgi:hypothetical protein
MYSSGSHTPPGTPPPAPSQEMKHSLLGAQHTAAMKLDTKGESSKLNFLSFFRIFLLV